MLIPLSVVEFLFNFAQYIHSRTSRARVIRNKKKHHHSVMTVYIHTLNCLPKWSLEVGNDTEYTEL